MKLKRQGIIAPTFLVVLFVFALLFGLYLINNHKISFLNFAAQATVSVTGSPTNPNENKVKLAVIVYDPILKTKGNVRLHSYFHWNDPKQMTDQMIKDLATTSHGSANYQLVEYDNLDEWAPYDSGKQYTEEQYLADTAKGGGNPWGYMGGGDYKAIITKNELDKKVNSGKVDEVWLWAYPGTGWMESVMAGRGAYYINGGPIEGVDTKAFILMGLNYERTVDLAEHSYGHRTEGIISRVFGGWRSDDKTLWNKYTLLNKDIPGKGSCGNIHFPVNGVSDYDYSNGTTVSSSCDDWYNYPNFKNVTTQVNCQAWGCNQWGYMKWWYTHLPNISGLNNGYLNNWWKYITNPEEYKDKGNFLTTTANPSHDFTKDPLSSWQCSAVNGTCDVFDETTQKLFGVKSIKYITDSGYDTQVSYSTSSGTLNIGSQKYLTFWVYAVNTNDNPIFESNSPTIYLKDKTGNSIKYQPGQSVLDQTVGKWTQFIIPLDGDGIWQKTTTGNITLSDVTTIEIHTDTWGYGFNLFFDNLGFTSSLVNIPDTTAPYVNITYPLNKALIAQISTASAEATDSSKISRVDFFIDGKYVDTDAITPFTYEINPAKLYATTHTLVTRAFDTFGNFSDSQITFASSGGPFSNKPPVARFTANPTTGRSPLAVSFTNTSSDPNGDALTYLWNFGDGSQTSKSTLKDPAHTFVVNRSRATDPKTKTFSVSLTVWDTSGKTSTYSLPITVSANNNPTASFTKSKVARGQVTKDGGKVSLSAVATDSDKDPLTYLWNFGDGGTSTLLNPPIHLYKKDGTYKITFTVSDNHAGQTIVEKSIVFP
jgi:PKD repeat protein